MRVQVTRRLVGQQKARLARQRARDRHTLLLTTRKLGRYVMQPRTQADQLDGLLDAPFAFVRLESPVAQRHVDIVKDIELRNQVEALENKADLLVANASSVPGR